MKFRTCDSVTSLDETARGLVVVTGSHGGRYPASLVAQVSARGAIFNDASGAKDESGVEGLKLLDSLGVPAAAVGHLTAVIGDGASTLRGKITWANTSAGRLGVSPGMPAKVAAKALSEGSIVDSALPPVSEARATLVHAGMRVVLLDSVSLVDAEDQDAIVVTGSHGALLGGRPATALKHDTAGAVYNDAGGGPGERGVSRLRPLAERGVPAAVVGAHTAKIGDARSTWDDGIITAVNAAAQELGARPGTSVPEFIEAISERRNK